MLDADLSKDEALRYLCANPGVRVRNVNWNKKWSGYVYMSETTGYMYGSNKLEKDECVVAALDFSEGYEKC